MGQSVATTQHLNRTENSQITNQPVHIRTLAVSASSTATSAVNLSPKPIALWTSPLLSLYLCLCVDVCLRACWCREALTPNVRGEQGKTAVPDDASNWKMLIVQDGSDTPREHSRPPQRRLAARTSRTRATAHPRHGSPAPRALPPRCTRATAHPLSSCLLAIVCSKCGALSEPSTRWFVGDHCEGQGDIIFGTKIDRFRRCSLRAGKGAQKDSRASRPALMPYWYKSTNTGTKVQILTQLREQRAGCK